LAIPKSTCALRKIFTLAFILLLFIFGADAQSATYGTVKGIIADSTELLTGASVMIVGTTIGVASDVNGAFLLSNVPSGQHTLQVTFLGFEKYTKNIVVEADKVLDLGRVYITAATKGISEVVVEGQMKKGSENQAISLTKNSQRVVTVISSENIKRLPDKNAADALKRVAGVAIQNNKGEGGYVSLRGTPIDWTSTLINGDRLPVADEDNTSRSFEFEVLPSDLIDRIDVTRTITPDLEGDNIGGSINFILKEPVDKRTFVLNSALGYNILSQKPTGNINLLWGDVTKDKKFRYVINVTARENFYEVDAFKNIFGNNFNHAINRYELKDYSGNRTNFGANTGFDWDITKKFKLGFKAMTGIMMDNKYQNKVAYTYASGDGTTVQPQFIHGLLNRQLFGGDINAEIKPNNKWKINLKYSGYYNRFYYGNPNQNPADPRNGYFTTVFTNVNFNFKYADVVPILQNGQKDPNNGLTTGSNPSWGAAKLLDLDNPWGTGDHYTAIKPLPNQPINAGTVDFLKAYSLTNYTYETDPAVAEIDVKHKFNDKVTMQFGWKERYKQGARSLGYHEWRQNPNNGLNSRAYYLSDFQTQGSRWQNFLSEYGSNYGGLQMPNMTRNQLNSFISTMEKYGNSPMQSFYMDPKYQDFPYFVGSNYDYKETQSAAYVMVDATVGKVNLVGGLRAEHTHLYEHANDLDYSASPLFGYDSLNHTYQSYQPETDSFTRRNYLAILPSLNVNYMINSKMQLRFATSRTFHRPNFQETKPGAALIRQEDFLYIKGNPNLRPTYSYNFDLSYQYFWGNKGLFTISAYGKYIIDHIFVTTTGSFDPLTYFVTKSYRNAGESWVCGIEGEIKRRFDFLPGFASGFGVGANVTYSVSRMRVPGRPGSQAMSEQSPLLYNVSIQYDKYGVKSSLALNYNSPYLLELNLATLPNSASNQLLHTNSDFDIFLGEQYSLDFQISYEFRKHFMVYFEANNLMDWAYKEYVGNPNRPLRVEYYKQRGQVGFKYEL
jgi:TonB-dependent receptor